LGGLAEGTQITNQATIVFDSNPPIDTAVWLNAVDNARPSSRVNPLQSTQVSITIPVSWAGTDVGTGVQDFTIYVSDNGAAFVPWLTNTTLVSAIYTGVNGHTYAFFSIARDYAGNTEPAKTGAEAVTTISLPPCAVDATNQFSISRAGFRLNNTTKRFVQVVTIKNNAATSLVGPFAFTVDGLSANATLYTPTGITSCAPPAGSPFVTLNAQSPWGPGQSLSVNLEFVNPTNAGITYIPRILAGSSNR
jgi:hypothetical protein